MTVHIDLVAYPKGATIFRCGFKNVLLLLL